MANNPFDQFDAGTASAANPFDSFDDSPLTPGNIDLANRPRVKNADGTTSTVRSMSFGTDQGEILVPTIADDGTELDEQQAIEQYRRTGKHLGIFGSADAATRYAEQLHNDQAAMLERDAPPQRAGLSGWIDRQVQGLRDVQAGQREARAKTADSVGKHAGGLWDVNAGSVVEAAGGIMRFAGEAPGAIVNDINEAADYGDDRWAGDLLAEPRPRPDLEGKSWWERINTPTPRRKGPAEDRSLSKLSDAEYAAATAKRADRLDTSVARVGTDVADQGRFQREQGAEASRVERPESLIASPIQAIKYFANQAAGSAVPMAIAVAQPEVGLSMFGAQGFGGEYAKRREEGMGVGGAAASGAVHAAAEVLPERLSLNIMRGEIGKGLTNLLGEKVAKSITDNIASRVVAGGLAEGGSEVVTQAMQDIYDIYGNGDDTTREQVLRNLVDAFWTGTVLGGPMAGAHATLERGADLLQGGNAQAGMAAAMQAQGQQQAPPAPATPPATPAPAPPVAQVAPAATPVPQTAPGAPAPSGAPNAFDQFDAATAPLDEPAQLNQAVAAQVDAALPENPVNADQQQSPAVEAGNPGGNQQTGAAGAAGVPDAAVAPVDAGAAPPAADGDSGGAGATARSRFDPDVRAGAAADAKLNALTQRHNLTPEQAADIRAEFGQPPPRDRVTGLHRAEELDGTIEAVQAAGEPAVYVETDLTNLGALNKKYGTEGANRFLRQFADTIKAELPADATVGVRKGGDETGWVITGVTASQAHAAMSRARQKFAADMQAEGLGDLPHTKAGQPAGVGLHFGISEIVPGVPIRDILAAADTQVEARKQGATYEQQAETGTAGPERDAGDGAVAGPDGGGAVDAGAVAGSAPGVARSEPGSGSEVRPAPGGAAPAAVKPKRGRQAAPLPELMPDPTADEWESASPDERVGMMQQRHDAATARVNAIAKQLQGRDEFNSPELEEATAAQKRAQAALDEAKAEAVPAPAATPKPDEAPAPAAEPAKKAPTARKQKPEPAAAPAAAKLPRGSFVTSSGAIARTSRGGKVEYDTSRRETLEAYFKPGTEVQSYGGMVDRVVSFDWNDGSWSVTVTSADGKSFKTGERTHMTLPNERQLVAKLGKPAPVQAAAPAPKAQPEAPAAEPQREPEQQQEPAPDDDKPDPPLQIRYGNRNARAGKGWQKEQPMRPDAKPEQTAKARYDIDNLVKRYGGDVVADRIARDFRENDAAMLLGYQVTTPESLAAIADVYRNPIFETLHYVFVDKDGKVVGETALSSRMPGSAAGFPDTVNDKEGLARSVFLDELASQYRAEGYWMIHNHPSGDPSPSMADLNFTKQSADDARAAGLKLHGHVVLNHTRYSSIKTDGTYGTHDIKREGADPLRNIRGNEAYIGKTITSPGVAAEVARDAMPNENSVTLITMDLRHQVAAVTSFPSAVLASRRAAGLAAMIGRRSAAGAQIAIMTDTVYNKNVSTIGAALKSGMLIDALVVRPGTNQIRSIASIGGNAGGFFSSVLERKGGTKTGVRNSRLEAPGASYAAALGVQQHVAGAFANWLHPTMEFKRAYAQAQGGIIRKFLAGAKAFGLRARVGLVDELHPLLTIENTIKEVGNYSKRMMNAYQRAELFHGRAGQRIRNFRREQVEPLLRDFAKSKLTLDELQDFLYAKFAPRRNEIIRDLHANTPNAAKWQDGGSGWSDAKAAKVLADFRAAGKYAELEAFANRVYAMNATRIDTLENAGLLSKETADEWRQEPHYVPLKDFADDREIAFQGTGVGRGKGYSIGGKESINARGRKSEADNLLENSIAQTELAFVRAEKNAVAQSLLSLVLANPNPNLWEVARIAAKPVRDPFTGEVLEDMYGNKVFTFETMRDDRPDVMNVKVNGKTVAIRFLGKGGEALATAMKNMGSSQLGWFMQGLRTLGRYVSLLRTSWNPEFVLSNFARDIQTAFANLTADESTRFAGRMLKLIRPALSASFRGEMALRNHPQLGQFYNEFLLDGGRTDYANNRTTEEIVKDIAGLVKNAKRGRYNAIRIARRAWEYFEAANTAVENASRLAAYTVARQEGRSRQDAASMAKNLTVNFNRHGTAGPAVNALYNFANASIQGNARYVAHLAKNPKRAVTRIALPLFALGFVTSLFNGWAGGDDDDGEENWAKTPDFERDRNFILMFGDNKVKIPMPYTYNLPFVIGSRIADVVAGRAKAKSVIASAGRAVLNSANPLGDAPTPLGYAAPTLLDPLAEIYTNMDFTGKPIRPENPYDKTPDPDSQKAWEGTPAPWRFLAEGINAATGGSSVRPGAVDVSPTTYEHLFKFALGGVGSFLNRSWTTGASLAKGELPDPGQVPFLRTVYGRVNDRQVRTDYYAFSADARLRVAEAELAEQEGRTENAPADLAKEWEVAVQLEPALKAADKQLTALRKQRKAAKAAEDDAAVKEADAEIRDVQADFNRMYVDALRSIDEPIR